MLILLAPRLFELVEQRRNGRGRSESNRINGEITTHVKTEVVQRLNTSKKRNRRGPSI